MLVPVFCITPGGNGNMTENDGAWFAAKRFGYGAGLPIAWQGWALVAIILGLPLGLSLVVLPDRPGYFSVIVIGIAVLFMPLIARKTRGGWKWRSGK